MAQNIIINGATYNGVASIEAPLAAGGGNAVFPDTSSGDAGAGDIASGKKAWVDGVEITGTATGGGSAPTTGWQPHPDWWDIKTILENDSQPGYTARYVFLLSDSSNTIDFPGTGDALVDGTAWKTSDGQFYTSATTHTWNKVYDKACALGYKTRYVIVYKEARDISISHRTLNTLYLYLDDCNILSCVCGGSSAPYNKILQSVDMSSNTTGALNCFPNYAFSSCNSLYSISVPSGAKSINVSAFAYCYSLQSITVPLSVASIGNSAFASCLSLQSIVIPLNVTSIGSSGFNYCASLVSVSIGENFDTAITLSASNYLSPHSMVSMFNNLKDNTSLTAKTLTLGATNLAKLTQPEKDIALNKNWNLA